MSKIIKHFKQRKNKMSIAILIIGVAIVFLLYANVRNQDTIAGNQVKIAEILKQIRDKTK